MKRITLVAAWMVAITMGSAEAHKIGFNKFLQRAMPQPPRTAGRVDNDARIAFSREQGRKLREEIEQDEAKRIAQ